MPTAKYDERIKKFGTNDVIPLWVADMDFKTAQPIIDALKSKAEEGIWGYTSRPDSYFDAICSWQQRRNGWQIDKSLVSGQGSRLYALTEKLAKPAVPFGGKYRIIDFPLSNCVNSGIDTVGILTQYQPLELNEYIGNGQPWDLDRLYGGVHVLALPKSGTGEF